MKVDGGCYCGSIRYEAEVDPAKVIIKLSDSAFRTVVQTEPGTVRLHTGTPKTFVKTGESGKRREQTFCPDCGSPIYSALEPSDCELGPFDSGINSYPGTNTGSAHHSRGCRT